MDRLFTYIDECCKKHNIDESHGLKHAIDTVEWAKRLIAAELSYVFIMEERMILYCAALHDMCDAKYRDPDEASEEIRNWLINSEKWVPKMATDLVNIIMSMSYSKLKARMIDKKPNYPDHGLWQRAYHIVRHADLLEGYKVRRCMLYTKHRLPQEDPNTYWPIVREVFETRIFKYVSDGWIFLPKAIELSVDLHRQAMLDLDNENEK
jgi:hypothetical protein